MEKCPVCNTKISRWEISKSALLAYRNLKCKNCNTEFEHKTKNKVFVGILAMFVLVVFLIVGDHYDLGSEKFVFALIVVFLITMLLSKQLRFKKVE